MRTTARVLSGLLQTDEDELEAFLRDRFAEAAIDPARAADARAILVRIGEALREPTPERLMSLEHVRRVLDEWSTAEARAKPERVHGPIVVVEAPPPAAPPPPGIRAPIIDSGKASPWVAPNASDGARAIDTTGPVKALDFDPALPFGGPPVSKMPMAPVSEDSQSGETEDVDLAKLFASSPVPFAQPAPGALLTLEQYAYFCVERALWPDHRTETCARYKLAPDKEEALHQHYRVALAASAELKARFEELRLEAQRQIHER